MPVRHGTHRGFATRVVPGIVTKGGARNEGINDPCTTLLDRRLEGTDLPRALSGPVDECELSLCRSAQMQHC